MRRGILEARRGDTGTASAALEWLRSLEGDELSRVVPRSETRYWGPPEAWVALAQAPLLAQTRDHHAALDMLGAALALRLAHAYMHLHDHPDLLPVREYPRFRELLRPRG